MFDACGFSFLFVSVQLLHCLCTHPRVR